MFTPDHSGNGFVGIRIDAAPSRHLLPADWYRAATCLTSNKRRYSRLLSISDNADRESPPTSGSLLLSARQTPPRALTQFAQQLAVTSDRHLQTLCRFTPQVLAHV
jgi:hypothetical protein